MELKKFLLYAIVIVLVDAFSLWPFSYTNGYGHGDLNAMEMAVFTGNGGLPAWAYGADFSFGWYALAHVVKDSFHVTAEEFAQVMNRIAAIISTCGLLLLFAVLIRFTSPNAALLTVILWRFVPEVWELNTYCHPWTLGFTILNLGFWIGVSNPGRGEASRPILKWFFNLTSILILWLALIVRGDLALFFPIVLVLVYLRYKETLLEWIVIFAGTIAAYVGSLMVSGFHSPVSRVTSFMGYASQSGGLLQNGALMVYGGGLAFFICTAVILVRAFKKDPSAIRFAGLWVVALLPTLALWLPIGVPARHFAPLYLVQSIVLGVAVSGLGKTDGRRIFLQMAGVLILIAGNSVLAETVYRMVIAERSPNLVQIGVERRTIESVPLGDFMLNHRAQERLNAIQERQTREILELVEGSKEEILVASAPIYRMNVLATERYGFPQFFTLEGKQIWEFRLRDRVFWTVDLPAQATLVWWHSLEELAISQHKELVLTGVRIPRQLIKVDKLHRSVENPREDM